VICGKNCKIDDRCHECLTKCYCGWSARTVKGLKLHIKRKIKKDSDGPSYIEELEKGLSQEIFSVD